MRISDWSSTCALPILWPVASGRQAGGAHGSGRGSWNCPGAASSSRCRNHHQHARPEPSRGLRHQRGHEVRSGSEAYRRADAADNQPDAEKPDRKSVGEGKSVSVRVGLGGRRIITKKKKKKKRKID